MVFFSGTSDSLPVFILSSTDFCKILVTRLMVIALQEKIAAFDACTFKSCFCITSEYFFNFMNSYINLKSD